MDDGGEQQATLKAPDQEGASEAHALSIKRNPLALACAVACLALDLATKQWAKTSLQSGHAYALFPPVVQMSLVTNTGAAFSMGNHNSLVVSGVATVVLISLMYWYFRTLKQGFPSALEQFGLSILIGAAAGNLVERYAIGHVTDFLDFMFVSFPVFNVADVLIDVGIGLLILSSILQSRKNARVEKP